MLVTFNDDVDQYTQAFVRQADAFSAMGEVEPALDALSAALRLDPLLRRSKGFQVQLHYLAIEQHFIFFMLRSL